MQRPTVSQAIDHIDDEVGGNSHVDLRQLTTRLIGEARPERRDAALPVDDDAVEVIGTVDELDTFEIRVAETQRA